MTRPTIDDRQLAGVLETWLRSDDGPGARRAERLRSVVDASTVAGQRHRWWPLVPVTRGAKPPATSERSGWAPAWAGVTSLILVVVLVSAVLLVGNRPAAMPGAGPGIDPADRALLDQLDQLWSGQLSLEAVPDVYATDAVHTALWTDTADRFVGPAAIAERIAASVRVVPSGKDYIRLPDDWAGRHRFLALAMPTLGVPCLMRIDDGQLDRHDCIMPMENYSRVQPMGPPPDGVDQAELEALIGRAWNGDAAAFDQVVSPEIVHLVAYEDGVVTSDVDEYRDVTGYPGGVESLAPSVRLPAPSGELRWADFSDVAGGTLCTFWARGDQIIRHDCVVPANGA